MQYFAEHLSRINSLALAIQAESPVTEVSLQGFKGEIFCDEKYTIQLPCEVQPAKLTGINEMECSFRVPCLTKTDQNRVEQWINTAPWSASELSKQPVAIYDRKSGQKLTDSITIWKQLPSEHWAELMDFWHCHKPHTNDEKHNPAYSVTEFKPQPGMAWVGDAYIVVDPSDIADFDLMQGNKIWKWDIYFKAIQNYDAVQNYDASVFIACILCELVDSHGIYSFLISDQDSPRALVWVFSRTTDIASPKAHGNGLKIFYSLDKAQFSQLQQTRGDVEEVELPSNAIDHLEDQLNSFNQSVPEKSRTLGPWRLGFLTRNS